MGLYKTRTDVLEAVSEGKLTLINVEDHYKDDKEIVMAAIRLDGEELRYATDRLKDDKEVVLLAVTNTDRAFRYASERLRDDREVLLTAIKDNSRILIYTCPELRNDEEILLTALKGDYHALHYASQSLKENALFCKEALRVNPLSKVYLEKSVLTEIEKKQTPNKKISFAKAIREKYAKKDNAKLKRDFEFCD